VDEGVEMRDDEKKAAGSMTIQGVRKVRIEPMDARVAGGILVSYDEKRGGWVIEQDGDDEKEVAFIKAWKRKDERDGGGRG